VPRTHGGRQNQNARCHGGVTFALIRPLYPAANGIATFPPSSGRTTHQGYERLTRQRVDRLLSADHRKPARLRQEEEWMGAGAVLLRELLVGEGLAEISRLESGAGLETLLQGLVGEPEAEEQPTVKGVSMVFVRPRLVLGGKPVDPGLAEADSVAFDGQQVDRVVRRQGEPGLEPED
jgi:hypothetical protein